jgi:cytochrome c oxidase subunit 2
MILLLKNAYSKGKEIHFKMRSQDVLHSAYMPYFRAQMNCVPGMVTEFVFEPIYTTAEYRELPHGKKVANINAIRAQKEYLWRKVRLH